MDKYIVTVEIGTGNEKVCTIKSHCDVGTLDEVRKYILESEKVNRSGFKPMIHIYELKEVTNEH